KFDNNCTILHIFPGITEALVKSVLGITNLKGVVLLSYGSGNTMSYDWFLDMLETAIRSGIIIYNVSQCIGGEVIQGRYETSKRLAEMGVTSGGDITIEAAITKLMYLVGNEAKLDIIKQKLAKPLSGEMDF
ncbi:MAG: L-asparaginase, partial [Cyclobacteriaceae bacterium]